MECEICKKIYTNKFTLKRHVKQFHSEGSESGMEEESNDSSTEKEDDSSTVYGLCDMDDVSINEEESIHFEDKELNNWYIIMKITNLKDKFNKLKDCSELWNDDNNLQLCVDTLRYGVHRLSCIIHELENGEILPHIKDEIKRLRDQ